MGTAGAGDAFTSSLSALLAGGETIENAMRAATVNATSVVGEVDTQGGLLRREALMNRVQALTDQLPITVWPN